MNGRGIVGEWWGTVRKKIEGTGVKICHDTQLCALIKKKEEKISGLFFFQRFSVFVGFE